MEDRFVKYSKLTSLIFLLFIGFLVAIGILFLLGKLLFSIFENVPWLAHLYMFGIVIAPGTLFITVFIIFFKRTLGYKRPIIRYLCLGIFSVILLLWAWMLVSDVITLVKHHYTDVVKYNSYQFWMLVGSVLTLFATGLLQAAGTEKEKDWLEKHQINNP